MTNVVATTGASGGVGRATAREFVRHGWHVGLIARNAARQ
jgi:NADP-dependent 3-hydroxy acid dehydrogenase YdfG